MSSVTVRQEIIVDVVADLALMDSVNFPKPVNGQTVKTRGYYNAADRDWETVTLLIFYSPD